MSIESGRLRIVFNGEIYNYKSLRREMQGRGRRFRSSSDTEVLLHLYSEFGASMVNRLRGMFAFAIWDETEQGLFLARDPFGIKPLYFSDDGRTFRFASQVKALLAGGGVKRDVEPAGHVGYFLWGSVPEPYTLYRDVLAFPPGHSQWIDSRGPRPARCDFDIAAELSAAASARTNGSTIRDVLENALRDSIDHHLVSDVPVGVFLSSGVDSGTLTALASETSAGVKAITLGFHEYAGTSNDEVPLARKLARRYGCDHSVAEISQADFVREQSTILTAMDQPTIDGVNTWFVARAAAEAGLKVAISGVGGDELLGGYSGFSDIPSMVSLARVPAAIPGFGRTFRALSAPLFKRFTSTKYSSLFEFGGSFGGAYLLRRSLFLPWELPGILDPDLVREGWETLQPILRMDEFIRDLPTAHARISALELTRYMRNTLLRDTDWAGMAHSLEIRTPLVDVSLFRELAPFLMSDLRTIPSKQNMATCPKDPLPEDIVDRPKTGFSVPVTQWTAAEVDAIAGSQRGLRGWLLRVWEGFQDCQA